MKVTLWNIGLICGAICVLTMIGIQCRNIHYYYVKRLDTYNMAKIYLNSHVCRDAKMRSKLGSFSKCSESENILKMLPITLAWYDFLEDMYICGHGRCEHFWSELATKGPYIILFMGSVLMWMAWNHHSHVSMMRAYHSMSLPLANPMIQGRYSYGGHDHVD